MTSASFRIEPFDAERHDRTEFSSGVPQVDNFLLKTANKLSRADNLRVHVILEGQSPAILGYHAINAHSVHYADLPPSFARSRPGHGNVPAAYISMIGVRTSHQGRGLGKSLLIDALKRIMVAADTIGIAIVLLDILDDGDAARMAQRRAMYAKFGFVSVPAQRDRLFLSMSTIRLLFKP